MKQSWWTFVWDNVKMDAMIDRRALLNRQGPPHYNKFDSIFDSFPPLLSIRLASAYLGLGINKTDSSEWSDAGFGTMIQDSSVADNGISCSLIDPSLSIVFGLYPSTTPLSETWCPIFMTNPVEHTPLGLRCNSSVVTWIYSEQTSNPLDTLESTRKTNNFMSAPCRP